MRRIGVACMATMTVLLVTLDRPALATWQNGEVITYVQDDWGDGTTTAGGVLFMHYNSVYASTFGILEVGIPGAAGYSMSFTGSDPVLSYLPASGTSAALQADLVDPSSSPSGVFGGEVTGLHLNVDYSDAGHTLGASGIPFGDLQIHSYADLPQVNGLTVRQFLAEAEVLLGGGTVGYSVASARTLAGNLNGSFSEGIASQFAQDHLAIVPEPSVAAAGMLASVVMLARRRRPSKAAA